MAVKAGELYVELTLNGEKYTTGLQKAGQETDKLNTTTANLATEIFVVQQAYNLATDALTIYTDAMISQYAEVKNFNAMTGTSIEQGGKWQDMMENMGLSLSDVTMAFRILSNNIQQALGDGDSGAAKAFKQLKVSLVDANGNMRDSSDILLDTISALQKIPAGYERNALAMDTLGRSYMNLNILLNNNKDALLLYGEAQKKVTEDGMAKYDAWKISMDKFNNTLGDTKAQIGEGLLPMFTQLITLLNNYVLPAVDELGNRLQYIGYVVAGLGSDFGQALSGNGQPGFPDIKNYEGFLALRSSIRTKGSSTPSGGGPGGAGPSAVGSTATTTKYVTQKVLDEQIQANLQSVLDLDKTMKAKLEAGMDYTEDMTEQMRIMNELEQQMAKTTNKELKNLWKDVVVDMRDNPAKGIIEIGLYMKTAQDAGTAGLPTPGGWSAGGTAWDNIGVGSQGSELWIFMKSLYSAGYAYQQALNYWQSGSPPPGVLIGTGGIKGKALGGSVSAGSPYIVGERGPEMFVPNQSGNIIPSGGIIHVHVDVDGNEIGSTMVDLIRLRTGARI